MRQSHFSTLKYAEIGLSWENLGKATLSHMKEAWNASKLQFHACNAGSSPYPGQGKISTERWAFQNAMLADWKDFLGYLFSGKRNHMV